MAKSGDEKRENGAQSPLKKGIRPSAFMRDLRPELYSDTSNRVRYSLTASELEFALETVTTRNDTNKFETFCRRLCQRSICPNLRPQSGPEGGGDSKADADTFPVANEVSERFFLGDANSGAEEWAFAISAQKTWSQKVRSDVEGLIATGRSLDRIYFITSRAARAKDRARIENELSQKHGVSVKILDRAWIVAQIIEESREDLAYNYLGVGQELQETSRLGPEDYSRAQQLEDIERDIANPETYTGMEAQLVTEALIAAKLSRNLERPRTETDGRFLRAKRLAEKYGSYRQRLECQYEHIWSSFWWFDEIDGLNQSYADFEEEALKADHARNVEWLVNLFQLLVNCVVHEHLTREECKLDERAIRLKATLRVMSEDLDRPNHRLEARTSLAIVSMNLSMLDDRDGDHSKIWLEFSNIVEEADGLGEFIADRLCQIVEIAGNMAGSDAAYADLIDRIAAFVAKRTSEAEGAKILLKRAEQLDFKDSLEMIRLLGRATMMLSKEEHRGAQIEAVQLLMLAYRSSGLLWAARAMCLFLAGTLVIEAEEDGQLPVAFVPVMKIWAWISLELRQVPDFLRAMNLLRGALSDLPLDESSKGKVEKDIQELDFAFGSRLLNADDAELLKLDQLPDILDAMALFASRTALLFNLGYETVLREDGSLPESESDEDVRQFLSLLASQPVAEQLHGDLCLNEGDTQATETKIFGVLLRIEHECTDSSILAAQSVVGALEAFFATTLDQNVMPHCESIAIELKECSESEKPSFELNSMTMTGTINWPSGLLPALHRHQEIVQPFLLEVAGKILAAGFFIDDPRGLLEKLGGDEVVMGRVALILAAGNSYDRMLGCSLTRLGDWESVVERRYPPKTDRPEVDKVDLDALSEGEEERAEFDPEDPRALRDHRGLSVLSVIDLHAWNQAGWHGVGYLHFDENYPPHIALLFRNKEAAESIFQRWRDRFGSYDEEDRIRVALIREIDSGHPCYYAAQIAPNVEKSAPKYTRNPIVMATRQVVMEPTNNENIEMFLRIYARYGAYYLMPAIVGEGEPEWLPQFSILKRELCVKNAPEIGEHDIEAIALRIISERDGEAGVTGC